MGELLKMSELASRTGVERSTIQHYLREGLLPGPVKRPHKNVAYYSDALVERIGLIRQLQTERNLPLSRIGQLFDDHMDLDAIRRWLEGQALSAEPVSDSVAKRALIDETGIRPEQLERLADLGFVRPHKRGRTLHYDPVDVAIVRSVMAMYRAGLNDQNGFELEDMSIYLESMRTLLLEELRLFTRILGKTSRREAFALAEAGLEGTSGLLAALRRRVVMDLLEEAKPTKKLSDHNASRSRANKGR